MIKFNLGTDSEPEMVNMEVLLSKMSSSKDAEIRSKCMKLLNNGLDESGITRIASLSLSSVSGSWYIENQERKYLGLRSRRNLSNNCPDNVVDSLLQAVRTKGVVYCKKYYTMKKNILKKTQNLESFTWSDRNAPIDFSKLGSGSDNDGNGKEKKDDDDEKITWDNAVEMVERGYRKFSPHMADLFMNMVNEKRIDVPAVDHKKGGAYCAGVVVSKM